MPSTNMSPVKMSEGRTSLLGALLTMLGPISMAIYTPAMPELVQAFATTDSAIKMSLSLYFAGFSVTQLLAGPAADAFGRRRATLVFLAVYLLGSVVAAFAPSVFWLLAGRLVQGIGVSIGATVARAIVRDQFIGGEAARILNMIAIMLAIGPALGPTIGGLSLHAFGWQSVFYMMIAFGFAAIILVFVYMRETGVPNRALLHPLQLVRAYVTLTMDMRVLCAALVLGGNVGALYAQATMLPFVLINEVGLSPAQYGVGMLAQTGSYFIGSLALRRVSRRLAPGQGLRFGLMLAGLGGLAIFLSIHLLTPNYITVMMPIALCSFGMAFIIPEVTTIGLMPHPKLIGSASALLGFVQMAFGFLGGVLASFLSDPLGAFGTIIPFMQLVAVLAFFGLGRALRRAERA